MQIKHNFSLRHFPTHAVIIAIMTLFYLVSRAFVTPVKLEGFLMVILGYFSLLLICITLLIGPLALLRWRRNPLNIEVRRDVGIWAGITGLLHVLLTFRGTFINNYILYFFVRPDCCGGYVPDLHLFGISNDIGLLATLLLLALTALSNTLSLRLLKGKWWKRLQRLTYPLVLLALLHTFIYQYINLRESLLVLLTILLLLLVLTCQGIGIAITLSRRRHQTKPIL
ncbi:MAG: ferric reductase-like transmembrane domain-containing protein [Ktedonobacteraceae bacterium]|nr:ferric reductase-like transmembrane domain-containing protein [Ktedonobacteraceae bacterium]